MNQEKNIFEKAENFIQKNNERINALEEAFRGNPQGYPKMVQEVKKLKEANLIEKGKHPGCDCPGSPPNVPPFYKTWAQCTSGSGGVTSCAGCCQGGVRTPDTPEDARVDGGEPKNPKNPIIKKRQNSIVKNVTLDALIKMNLGSIK